MIHKSYIYLLTAKVERISFHNMDSNIHLFSTYFLDGLKTLILNFCLLFGWMLIDPMAAAELLIPTFLIFSVSGSIVSRSYAEKHY